MSEGLDVANLFKELEEIDGDEEKVTPGQN